MIEKKKIKKIGITIIIFEWAVLTLIVGVFVYTKIVVKRIESIIRIHKDNVYASASGELKYFYEWKPRQEIVHTRTWLPKTIIATTNSDGIISDREYKIEKPEGTFRIIALGDSFTEGPFVEYENTFPKQLEKKLNSELMCQGIESFEVLNFGVGGYDIEYAARRFITRGQKYNPDIVLWFVKDDDFIESAEVVREKAEEYIDQLTEEEKNDISIHEKYDQRADSIKKHGNLWEMTQHVVIKELEKEADQGEFLKRQTSALEQVVKSVYPNPVVMVTFVGINKKFEARMKLWQQNYDNFVYFKNIHDMYTEEVTFLPNDGHPNKRGYQMISGDIYSILLENFLDTCVIN